MRLVVAVVGKARNPALGDAIRDYETRAARYWPLDVHEVREERATGETVDRVREREGARLAERVPESAQQADLSTESGREKERVWPSAFQRARTWLRASRAVNLFDPLSSQAFSG